MAWARGGGPVDSKVEILFLLFLLFIIIRIEMLHSGVLQHPMERHTRASWWVSHRLLAGGNLHLCITPYYFLLKKISHNLLAGGGEFLAYINFYVSSASCVVHEIGESFSLSLKVSKDHKLSPSWWLRSMLEITLENATNDMYCKYTNNMCHFL